MPITNVMFTWVESEYCQLAEERTHLSLLLQFFLVASGTVKEMYCKFRSEDLDIKV